MSDVTPTNGESRTLAQTVKIHSGVLKIGGTEIQCFVLVTPDGQEPKRILSGRAVTKAFNLTGRGQGMSRFVSSERIRAHMADRLVEAIHEPYYLATRPNFPPVLGYEAWVLPELCNAILDADDEKPLPHQQRKMATAAKVLSRGLAITGITALVDEATGYQEVRDRLALEKILNKYISEEMQPYVRMFPEEFYRQMWRLLGWEWRGMSVPKPKRVGQLTDDLIYKRLAPGVRDALRSLVPRTEKGNLVHKLHSHLTPEEGRKALDRHLHAVTALMSASTNWKGFERMVDRAFPRFGDTMQLPLEDADEA